MSQTGVHRDNGSPKLFMSFFISFLPCPMKGFIGVRGDGLASLDGKSKPANDPLYVLYNDNLCP